MLGGETSINDISLLFFQRIEWHASASHQELCYLKGKSEVSEVWASVSKGRLSALFPYSWECTAELGNCFVARRHNAGWIIKIEDGLAGSWICAKVEKQKLFKLFDFQDDCQNYIRVLAKIAHDKLLICGSNAYKPYCRHYRLSAGDYVVDKEFEGRGLCPFEPDHNSTAVYSDGQLYTATVADFSGGDPLIYREPLRTERSDLKQLNGEFFLGEKFLIQLPKFIRIGSEFR